ncbi:SIR2 family protein [Bathymodiolus thermophilus thioautotrophic gill symbiont]|uniref:SIR2 family protein n=1 Tax=Bathymodiolus thermophilus thioautotrophic gill symbiont TaxID=2360 RepID=A0A1J5UI21_9GAMM|nr:SIR2 family protein [Bathymodiolus thermophilus thioautotrophic gill symbiont]OIR23927.1 SIR2 family protein [Bathymodiolus thermophilus thioautotrophic gill symbiont]
MKIKEFISRYRNHPVLFLGAGVSLRYLNNSYTWDGLLRHISKELKGNNEYYLDIKASCEVDGCYDFLKIASLIESDFNSSLLADRNGKFKNVNDVFYKNMEKDINHSRFKIYISILLNDVDLKDEMRDEISELKKIRKNIASIITTNYDRFVEEIFEFQPLIGNDILLSNPYGSVYKIHGCVTNPLKIIITKEDYDKFDSKYELIRAQLLSIFIHNPIVFMGYGIGDENIKSLLKTIFTYVDPNSDDANKIRDNFLLVEHEKESSSHDICEHDIDLEGFSTIRINKIKTDDFKEVYSAISDLTLPISAMDIRKVQNVVKEIYAGGSIKVNITEDLDSLNNNDKIIAIGSAKTIQYQYQTSAEMMGNYFNIIDESNSQILTLINKYTIQKTQYFPVFAFSIIYSNINNIKTFKERQREKVQSAINLISESCKVKHNTIDGILSDTSVTESNKNNAVLWSTFNGGLSLEEVEGYLRGFPDKSDTPYRRILCAYDIKKYGT